MIASLTPLPVIGVPIKSRNSIDGWDSVLSILQMPEGVPVATVALNGAKNAGILAVQIVGTSDPSILNKIELYKEGLKTKVINSSKKSKSLKNLKNPLLAPFRTPHQSTPFGEIKPEHFIPAIKKDIQESLKAINKITDQKAQPSFDNTINALQNISELLERNSTILFNLNSARNLRGNSANNPAGFTITYQISK